MINMSRLNNHLSASSGSAGPPGLLVVLWLAGMFVGVTFSLDFVRGTSSYWLTEVDDITQYVAGFNLYFGAPWQWPLLAFDGLNFPVGTRVTFVDAIPLYAMLLKWLVPQSWAPFNPFGIWVMLCFLLQAVAAWWIARELKTQSWAFLTGLTLLFLSFPALMARLGHISLMSHWVVLFAFALYIRGHVRQSIPLTGWTCLLVASFYVNVYLFVMAAGIYGAAWLTHRALPSLGALLQFLIPCVVLGISSLVTLFPLPAAEVTPEWGFGYYSMNLLSPWTGGSLLDWQVKEAPGQYEGFNYLGLGVIAAFLLALPWQLLRNPLALGRGLKKHWALVVLLGLYSVYALSNQIYWADEQIAVIHYPAFMNTVTSQFRASGRFFWPVGYALMIWTLWVWRQQKPHLFFVGLVVSLLLVQGLDLRDRYRQLRATQSRPAHTVFSASAWDQALGHGVRHIYFYPKFKCGKDPHGTLLPMMKYAAERKISLNTGYIARYTPDCHDVAREIATSDAADSAYVFVQTEFPDTRAIAAMLPVTDRLNCQSIQFAQVCRIQRGKPGQ